MIKNYIFKIITVVASILVLSGCQKSSDKDCFVGSPAISEQQIQTVKEYIDQNNIKDAIYNGAGFYFVVDAPGSRKYPTGCSEVVVNYSGHLVDGKEFDRASDVTFNLNQLIPGWRLGLPLIQEGGIITLYLPADLGYGSDGVANLIPQNSVTIFKIELLKVN